jgi:O-antigen ligase
MSQQFNPHVLDLQSASAYPLWRQASVTAPLRSGVMAYARALTLTVWLFSLVVSLWWVRDFFALQEMAESGFNRRSHFYFGFAVALIGHLTLGIQAWMSAPFVVISTWSGRLMTLFCLLMLALAPISLAPRTSAQYAVATWIVLMLCTLYWMSNYYVLQRVTVFTGIALLGFLYLLLFQLGLVRGFGSQIGGINRNITGTIAVGAMILCMLSQKFYVRWIACGAAVALAVSVTSRGSLVAMGAFFAVYYTTQKGTWKAALHAALGMALVGFIFLLSASIQSAVVDDVFLINDRARGMGSGFTGRVDTWKQAIELFWKRPVFGYGFRASLARSNIQFGGIHSGYLRILVDSGLVGGFFVISAVVMEGIRRFRLAMQLRKSLPGNLPGINVVESFRINSVACATFAMTLVLWIYEQHYVNVGAVISLVLFLMLAAPSIITSEGNTQR